MASIQYKMNSSVGPLYLVTSEEGLHGILWKPQNVTLIKNLEGSSPEMKYMIQAVKELNEYFAGQRKKFDIPIRTQGTDFQNKVWNELKKIPYGQTTSYKDIAEKLGTKGVRAVGTANGRNPLSIIVPCHRVINTGGGLGGYAGGLDIKRKLLALELA